MGKANRFIPDFKYAGKDGTEIFRRVFYKQAKVVVVLYRHPWGENKFTKVESLAIQDRFLGTKEDFLIFVMLESGKKPPDWLPKTFIYCDYKLDELIGIIKDRVMRSASIIRTESAIQKAKRIFKEEQDTQMRNQKLLSEGREAAKEEWKSLIEQSQLLIQQLNQQHDATKLEDRVHGYEYVARSAHCSLSLQLVFSGRPSQMPKLKARFYRGQLKFPGSSEMYIEKGPSRVKEEDFSIDLSPSSEWRWRKDEGSTTRLFTSAELSEQFLSTFMDFYHEYSSK